MNLIYLLLGSNLGDRHATIFNANQLIQKEIGEIIKYSKIYQTAAWGVTDQPSFLNQVIAVSSEYSANTVLNKIHLIEKELGRKRFEKWHARTIDIDILYFNNEIINTTQLKVPHPEIHNRKFTLIPLCEIAKDYNHPVLNLSNKMLLEKCNDELEVELVG